MADYTHGELGSVQESEVEIVRQQLTLEKITKPLRRWAAIGAVAGAGLASSIAFGVHAYGVHDYENHLSLLEADNTHMEELRTNMDRLNETAGEACVAALRVYITGGALENTDENTVVNDLFGDTNKPCGDSPTKIRTTLRPIRDADKNITDLQTKISKNETRAANEKNTNENMPYVLCAAIGSIMGLSTAWGIKRYNLGASYSRHDKNYIYQINHPRLGDAFHEYNIRRTVLDMRTKQHVDVLDVRTAKK